MKNFFKSCGQKFAAVQFMLLAIAISNSCDIYAQEKQSISGKLVDHTDRLPVPYATVKLSGATNHEFIGGSISDPDGVFTLGSVAAGKYILCISSIGYKPDSLNMEVVNGEPADAGIIELHDTTLVLDELEIVSERIKAKSEQDKTIFFVTNKMLEVSSTGTDLLRLIPGIQVDFMQNISLEGSSDILILVDGKERDKRYLSQLSPARIDQIEVLSAPPANYDGDATGAINIILKKDRESGFNGHLLAEVPVLYSEIYIFPSYSLNFTHKKLNVFTSYNGEVTWLDLHENTRREFRDENGNHEISINQFVRQKEWSHRFHFGFDYFLSEHDHLNFYSFYNPYSRELDGKAFYQTSGAVNNSSEAGKEDTDMNTGSFYSLYYKHGFNKKGSELTADLSTYILKAENRSDYIYGEPENNVSTISNVVKPKQNAVNMKIDYKTLFGQKFSFGAGVKVKYQVSNDRNSDFEYTENIYALYTTMGYKKEKFDLGLGLRFEESLTELKDAFNNPFRSLLPDISFRYKLNTQQNIQLSASRSIKRPNLYQMNPYIAYDDPFTISMGNPLLNPELTSSIYFEHSIQFDGSYFASRVFYTSTNDVISNLMLLNDTNTFVKEIQNLGTIVQAGIQFSGSMKIHFLTFNPYVKIFALQTKANQIAENYGIKNRKIACIESGLSAIVSLGHELAVSMTFQYNSPVNELQGNTFSDMLYFISIGKTFKQKLQLGIVSAIPFSESFTFHGSKITGSDIYSSYEGNVSLSAIPLWIKIGYQFNTGKSRNMINREKEHIDNLPKKGF